MTRKEAIEILKRNKPTSDQRRCGTELCEAVDMAIEALEKQIPKKPVSKFKYRHSKNVCPSCETDTCCRHVMFWEKFCPDCGQAIDWSELE